MNFGKNRKIMTRDDILGAKDIKIELVPTPEWPGDVYVKGMTGQERDDFEASIIQTKGKVQSVNMQNVRAKLAAMSICDEQGKRLFSESDVIALSKKSASALTRVFTMAQKLSGIGADDLEELTAGLKENPLDGSASD